MLYKLYKVTLMGFFFFKVKPEHPFPAKQKKTVNVKVCTRYVSSAATNEKRKEDRVSKAL